MNACVLVILCVSYASFLCACQAQFCGYSCSATLPKSQQCGVEYEYRWTIKLSQIVQPGRHSVTNNSRVIHGPTWFSSATGGSLSWASDVIRNCPLQVIGLPNSGQTGNGPCNPQISGQDLADLCFFQARYEMQIVICNRVRGCGQSKEDISQRRCIRYKSQNFGLRGQIGMQVEDGSLLGPPIERLSCGSRVYS